MSARGRAGDVVPEDATAGQLFGLLGEDAHEVVAFRALMVRIRDAQLSEDLDAEGRARVGENYFAYATGEIGGRELCEREGLLPGPAS